MLKPLITAFILAALITAATAEPPTDSKRIVTLSPHASELAYNAGGGARLVGVAAFSDYPPEVASLPRTGDAAGLDREQLLRLKPDLVIYWHDGISWADREWLRKEGIASFESHPLTPEEIGEEILFLGKLLGSQRSAEAAYKRARQLLAAIDLVGELSRSDPPTRLTHQLWNRPPMVLNANAILPRTLEHCGIINPVDIEAPVSTTVTTEYLWHLESDAIAIADDAFFEPLNPSSVPVIAVDADRLHRPTLRMLEAALALCLELRRIE